MTEAPEHTKSVGHRPPQHTRVTVHVNERPVHLREDRVTGLQIKQAAIEQHIRIELDFILVEELGHHRTRVVGDDDEVHVTNRSRFLANDGDDDS
jgi:hypothetical protein